MLKNGEEGFDTLFKQKNWRQFRGERAGFPVNSFSLELEQTALFLLMYA